MLSWFSRSARLGAVAALCAAPALAETPAPRTFDLNASDGTKLKATYYDPGRPGPGLLLLHQCNRDRTSWTTLATDAAARGFHVLTLDYRGFGESGGDRFGAGAEQQTIVAEKWPGDVDAAFAWLVARPGVARDRIGAAGASCGVNQSVLLASRHPEVKALALLSGNVIPAGRAYMRQTSALAILGAASHDDGDAVDGMRWLLAWSRNPNNRFVEYKAAGHGTDMFAVERGLPPTVLDWFDQHLRRPPAATTTGTTAARPASTPVIDFWDALEAPGGVARARQIYDRVRREQPTLRLFPEGEMNQHGYRLLQEGRPADAVEVFRMNVEAYPTSANVYDSLSDAYLASGNKAEALRHAEKALEVLATDTRTPEGFRTLVRESAEKKVRELKKAPSLPAPGR